MTEREIYQPVSIDEEAHALQTEQPATQSGEASTRGLGDKRDALQSRGGNLSYGYKLMIFDSEY